MRGKRQLRHLVQRKCCGHQATSRRFSRLACLLSSRILQINLLDLYLLKIRRKSRNKSLPCFCLSGNKKKKRKNEWMNLRKFNHTIFKCALKMRLEKANLTRGDLLLRKYWISGQQLFPKNSENLSNCAISKSQATSQAGVLQCWGIFQDLIIDQKSFLFQQGGPLSPNWPPLDPISPHSCPLSSINNIFYPNLWMPHQLGT